VKSIFASNLKEKIQEIRGITDTSPQLRNEFLSNPVETLREFGLDSQILIDADTGRSVLLSQVISDLSPQERATFTESVVYKQYAGDGGDGGDGDDGDDGDDADDSDDDTDDADDTDNNDNTDVAMAVAVTVAMNVAVVAEAVVAVVAVLVVGDAPPSNAGGAESIFMNCKSPIAIASTSLDFTAEFQASELYKFFSEAGLSEYRQKSLLKMAMSQSDAIMSDSGVEKYSYSYRGEQLRFAAIRQGGKAVIKSGFIGV